MQLKIIVGCIVALSMIFAAYANETVVKNGEKIAFVGDSITQFGNRPDGFIHLVMDGLKKNGITAKAIPAGVGGNKSNDILKRLSGILKKKPDWMVLQCGTNDVGHGVRGVKLKDYRKNIAMILDAAQSAGVRVMLVTPSMHTENPGSANNRKLEGYCDFIRSQAVKRRLLLADWNKAEHEAIRKRAGIRGLKLTIDNLHLNGYGNRYLAMTILAAFGVPEKKIETLIPDWDKIPSMTPILNAWHNPKYKISIRDYEILYRIASDRNISVEQLVKYLVAKRIEEEKRKSEKK
jgi:lysophospholipase L1-like esterase